MDFLALPPEVTSALIHSGPGARSLIEASVGWQRLGTELEESVPSYTSVLSSLIESWSGPSSIAMAQAVQPYLSWLGTTGQQCQRLASSAQAAAAAFNSALSGVVPPAYVSANRTRLAQLLATNWFGSNLAAIAATEDQYEGMWANNSAAMYRYQAASAQALALPQFASPPSIANPTAEAAQAASTAQSLASPLDGIVDNGWFQLANTYANQFISSGFPINLLGYLAQATAAQALQIVGGDVGQGLSQGESALGSGGIGSLGALGAAGLQEVSPTAAVGVGVTMGKLTGPPAVVGLLPASQAPVQLASAVSPLPSGEFGLPAIPMPPIRMPTVSARGRRREGRDQENRDGRDQENRKERDYENIEYGLELKGTVMHRPPSAG